MMEIWKEAGGTELVCHTMHMGPDSLALFHFHENYEFCQPLEQPCDFLVNGTLFRAEPGDILTVAPQVIHRFLPRQPDTRIRVLQFPMRILLSSGASAGALQTHISKQALEEIPGLYPAVTALMEMMAQEPRVYTGQKNELLQSLMTSLYLLLRKYFPAESRPGLHKDADLFFRAAEFANTHFTDETITVERMAGALYVSREKLSSVFLQYAGISCKQYISALRIDYVNQLLLEGWNITNACLKSGFGSIRTFNNVYKTVMGITPTEYLKAHEKSGFYTAQK